VTGESDPRESWLRRFFALLWAGFVNALFAGLAILGILSINAAVRDWRSGEAETGAALAAGLFGLVMALIGGGFFWLAYFGGPRFLQGLERRREKSRDRPWLANRHWRARRAVHATGLASRFMWLWCLVWWGVMGLIWFENKDMILAELRGSWSQAVPVAAFVVAGIAGLLVAAGLSWRRWRHGNAVLLIDTLPGYLGERFRGKVQARLPGRPSQKIGISLACVSRRRTRRSSGAGRYATVWVDDELWSTSAMLHPAQATFDRGRITVPVSFELPADLPESGHLLDEPQIVWMLTVAPGAVARTFEVPVFARRDGI